MAPSALPTRIARAQSTQDPTSNLLSILPDVNQSRLINSPYLSDVVEVGNCDLPPN